MARQVLKVKTVTAYDGASQPPPSEPGAAWEFSGAMVIGCSGSVVVLHTYALLGVTPPINPDADSTTR